MMIRAVLTLPHLFGFLTDLDHVGGLHIALNSPQRNRIARLNTGVQGTIRANAYFAIESLDRAFQISVHR